MTKLRRDSIFIAAMVGPAALQLILWQLVSAFPFLVNSNTLPANPLADFLGALIVYTVAVIPIIAAWYIIRLPNKVSFSFIAFEIILYALFWGPRIGWYPATNSFTQAEVQIFALMPTFLIIGIAVVCRILVGDRTRGSKEESTNTPKIHPNPQL